MVGIILSRSFFFLADSGIVTLSVLHDLYYRPYDDLHHDKGQSLMTVSAAYMFKPFSTVRATASGSTDHHPSLQANLYGHLVASWLPFSIIEQCFAEIIFNRILNTINQKSCCLTVDRNFPAPVARNIRPECQSIPNR